MHYKKEDIEDEDISFTGIIETPFDPKRIDISTKQMIIGSILIRLRNDEVDLKTFFQRGLDLWDDTKKSRLIESILIRLPLPAFYFDGSDDNKWLVVDGLQRLSTFKSFMIDKTLKLKNLEYLTQFNDYSFDLLPRDLQRRIEEHEITVYIINSGTPPEVKFNLFKRINTGGLVLNSQEIRHALNQGVITELLSKLSDLKSFKQFEISKERMLDRDFITRFLAFYLISPSEYKPDLDGFINKALLKLKQKKAGDLNKIVDDFDKSMTRIYRIFGKYAFRKMYSIDDNLKSKNKSLFEVFSVLFAKLSDNDFEILLNSKSELIYNFVQLMKNSKDFEKSITSSTGDPKNVKFRFFQIFTIIRMSMQSEPADKRIGFELPKILLTRDFSKFEYQIEKSIVYAIKKLTDKKNLGNKYSFTTQFSFPYFISFLNIEKLKVIDSLLKAHLFTENDAFKTIEAIFESEINKNIAKNIGLDENSENNGTFGNPNFEQNIGCDIVFDSNNIVIFEILHYLYSGGAHGLHSYDYLIIDVENEKKLSFSDIFEKSKVSNIHKKVIDALKKDNDLRVNLFSDTFEDVGLSENFYFDKENFYFVYAPYEIGTYSLGSPQIKVPISELKPFLKTNFINKF